MVRVFRADEFDCLPCEFDRARGGADLAGEPGCPGTEFDEVKPRQLGRIRHRRPERERSFEVRVGLRQAEDRLGLACGFDRRCERLGHAACRGPVRCELRCSCRSTARELVGQPRVQLLALPGRIVA